MSQALTLVAALLGFVGVACGAFGAHGLEGKLSEKAMDWWQTGTFYLLIHAVAAFAAGLSGQAGMGAAGWGLAIGASIFAGTLYAMALGAPTILGAVTPIGGTIGTPRSRICDTRSPEVEQSFDKTGPSTGPGRMVTSSSPCSSAKSQAARSAMVFDFP